MRTIFHLLGVTLTLSMLGLFGCTGSETTGGVEVGGSAGSAGSAGSPAWVRPLVIPVKTGTKPVRAQGSSSSTGSAQGGSGGATDTVSGGGGATDTTEPPQGGAGGAIQTITVTTETTTSASTTTDTGLQTITATSEPTTASTTSSTTTETATSPLPITTEPLPGGPTSSPGAPPGRLGPEDVCPGIQRSLSAGGALAIDGSTLGMRDDTKTRCGDVSTGANNADVVYQVNVLEDVTLGVQLVTTEFLPALEIRMSTCESERVEDLCIGAADVSTSVSLALSAGTYWFVIDSADGRWGSFWLGLTAAAPACGDGVVNPASEECDVGAGMPNDGCFDPGAPNGCMYGEPIDPGGPNP